MIITTLVYIKHEHDGERIMHYNQYQYNIFNQSALEEFIRKQQQNQETLKHHKDQQENILDIRRAIRDYCNAARKVTPDYQTAAINACMEEIMIQMMQDSMS